MHAVQKLHLLLLAVAAERSVQPRLACKAARARSLQNWYLFLLRPSIGGVAYRWVKARTLQLENSHFEKRPIEEFNVKIKRLCDRF